MIRFACPGCASTFSVDDSKAGKSGKCPKCQAQFIIPQLEAAPAPAPPPVPAPVPAPVPVSVQPTPAADPNAPVEIDPCPKCQTKLSVTTADLGNDVECPYCKTVFASTKAGTRPPAPPVPPGKKSNFETDFSSRPKAKKRDDDDDDDRPRKRRRDDDDDDRPSKRKRDDEDDDDRPARRSKAASRRDDDDEDDRPSKRRRSRRDDDDDDDDYDDRPRRRGSRRSRPRGSRGPQSIAPTIVGALTILFGLLWLYSAGSLILGWSTLMSLVDGAPRGPVGPQRDAVERASGFLLGCGFMLLLIAILHIGGGVAAILRKTAGRIMVIISAVIELLIGLLVLYAFFELTMLVTPPIGAVLRFMLILGVVLGYSIFSLVVMCRSDYAEEFD